VWGVGSGLASVTLVFYFVNELDASDFAKAWILAAPSMAGLLRLFTPLWMERIASRRKFCIALFLASSAALAALPMLAAPGTFAKKSFSISALSATWTTYQVLEYIGAVALWSWFGDFVPSLIRGRFIGRREGWMTAGLVIGGLLAAAVTWFWQRHCVAIGEPQEVWRSYAACAYFGGALMAMATLPLAGMRDAPVKPSVSPTSRLRLRDLLEPLADARFRRLMLFGLWFSIANGLVYAPRQAYLVSVLKLEFAHKRALDGASRGIQAIWMPWTGRVVDRRGNVPVLAISWGVVSFASIFFVLATPTAKWWIVGAYACWVAYAGVNVPLPNLMLGLSRPGRTAAYAAAWFAWPQLAYSLSVLAGGWLLNWTKVRFEPRSLLGWRVDHFAVLFSLSVLVMAAGVALALRIPESTGAEDEIESTSAEG
jgi:MFS family permease